jgi:hypothetical protein
LTKLNNLSRRLTKGGKKTSTMSSKALNQLYDSQEPIILSIPIPEEIPEVKEDFHNIKAGDKQITVNIQNNSLQ